MALPVSSLSVALQGFADFLDSQFGQEVIVSLDSPQKAAELAKGNDEAVLNVFVYRLAPSGFHAEAGFQDPLFIRANVLLTCFPPGQGNPSSDTDLRVLGHAMAVLHSLPTIPVVLPGAAPLGAPPDDFRRRNPVIYQIQAVLQAPTMEEMNHIWTTQGGELAYRLSCAYELSLIPVEPLSQPPITGRVLSGTLDIGPSSVPVLDGTGLSIPGPDVITAPLFVQLFTTASGLTDTRTVAPNAATVEVALAGQVGGWAALSVSWIRADGTTAAQPPQVFPIASGLVSTPSAKVRVTLTAATNGDRATISAVPAAPNGTPLPGREAANPLTLTVGA
ncbi:Pvc16 family protein [Tabrizicola sp.]|uniref:Pvc16 family protein n=1 Tax=Tabrizicola sp. TaxID=2005166 RepID=UPI00286D18B6|nr:Pvc16 family protein [Tabrizicola sp.]